MYFEEMNVKKWQKLDLYDKWPNWDFLALSLGQSPASFGLVGLLLGAWKSKNIIANVKSRNFSSYLWLIKRRKVGIRSSQDFKAFYDLKMHLVGLEKNMLQAIQEWQLSEHFSWNLKGNLPAQKASLTKTSLDFSREKNLFDALDILEWVKTFFYLCCRISLDQLSYITMAQSFFFFNLDIR